MMRLTNTAGKSTTIDVVDRIQGVTVDDNGYVHPTHNWDAGEGWEVDDQGNRTVRYVYYAMDNASISEWEYRNDDTPTLRDWLESWYDDDCVESMRSEGLLS